MIANNQLLLASKGNILIVDDTPENLLLLSTLLTEQGYQVRKAINGQLAVKVAQKAPPDLILLDILMPDMTGYEVLHQLKANEKTKKIPIIFVSVLEEVSGKIQAFKLGGADYITKPFQVEEVLARIEHQLSIRQREIIERQQHQSQLLQMTLYDSLTGLPNRTLFMKRLKQTGKRAEEQSVYQFAVLFLDCDRFKTINDSLGHSVGDELLVALARRIKAFLSPSETLARLGSDEFAILLENIADISCATLIAERILQQLLTPFQLSRYEVFISASIGITLSNLGKKQPEHLLRNAETAMYRAKALGKFRYHIFDPAMHQEAMKFLQIESDLRRAIDREEFVVYYQPIISLTTNKIAGFEALVRWQHPTRVMVPPAEFIPVAEETGLIASIDIWVLREACYQLRNWQLTCRTDESLTVSVNLSARLFSQPNLIQTIDKIIHDTQINPQSLKLEITESAIMENTDSASSILQDFRARNIQLSIDDFGTGYSSLSYLQKFPVNTLKIDKSFVSRMHESSKDRNLISMIINIAHTMGMSVVAEGVETVEQLSYLRDLGCDFTQGYLFYRPLESQLVLGLLAAEPIVKVEQKT